MKTILISEHNEIVSHVEKIDDSKNFVFVNFDAHADMSIHNGELDIGNFITYLVKNGNFSDVLWIKNDISTDFEDGVYDFNIWMSEETGEWVCDLEKLAYLGEGYSPSLVGANPKKIKLEVISESKMQKTIFSNRNWILSVDCDFFSCSNPFREKFEKAKLELGIEKFNEIFARLKEIKSYNQWITFKKELIVSGDWEKFDNCMSSSYPEEELHEQEIDRRINRMINFLKNNFKIEDCLGKVVCASFFSGYTTRSKCPQIVSLLQTYLNNLHFFWKRP